jgi:2-keto-4-pentenoate hydratase/2-oxohepta-3-ene-1,7-dioic acid hydratase in catechol pathway
MLALLIVLLCSLASAASDTITCNIARVHSEAGVHWAVPFPASTSNLQPGQFGDGKVVLLSTADGVPLRDVLNGHTEDMAWLLCQYVHQERNAPEAAANNFDLAVRDFSEVVFLSPLTEDTRSMMLGLNYVEHAKEAGLDIAKGGAEFSMMFPKLSRPTSATANVLRPPHVKFLDYEVETGVVLRKDLGDVPGTVVTDTNVHEFVAGVLLVHDFTSRDTQLHQQQWVKGKGYRTFGPTGPWIVLLPHSTAAAAALRSVRMKLWCNEQLRQDASTDDLITDVGFIFV